MTESKDIVVVLRALKKRFPNPGAMELGEPYRTTVGVILSARTRDEQVLKLLPGFFNAFPTVEKLAGADQKSVEAKINTIGMYRQKAKNIRAMAKLVATKHKGVVPRTMEELVELPGVGRKTASVNQVFVKFGRYVCIPGTPRCWTCPIKDRCAYTNKNLVVPKDADAMRGDIERRERELERLREAV
ncbi:hypothetical protein EBS80_03385 [bacterium]|nr:hypothetical protein [bacterium]